MDMRASANFQWGEIIIMSKSAARGENSGNRGGREREREREARDFSLTLVPTPEVLN